MARGEAMTTARKAGRRVKEVEMRARLVAWRQELIRQNDFDPRLALRTIRIGPEHELWKMAGRIAKEQKGRRGRRG